MKENVIQKQTSYLRNIEYERKKNDKQNLMDTETVKITKWEEKKTWIIERQYDKIVTKNVKSDAKKWFCTSDKWKKKCYRKKHANLSS